MAGTPCSQNRAWFDPWSGLDPTCSSKVHMLQLKLLHAAKTEHSQIHIKEKKKSCIVLAGSMSDFSHGQGCDCLITCLWAMKMREAGSQLWELKPTGVDTRDSCVTGSAW